MKDFKVKYCSMCETAYEMVKDTVEYYLDFPSYGLEREDCSKCEGVSTETNIPPTLEEKATDQRKNLFKKEVERFNKEVERYNK